MSQEQQGTGYEAMAFSPIAGKETFLPGDRMSRSAVERAAEQIHPFIGLLKRWAASFIDNVFLYAMACSIGPFIVDAAGASSETSMIILPFVFIFGAIFLGLFYFWLTEAFFGATLGKWALQIRVVSVEGESPGLGASFIRSLLRAIEMSPIMLNGLVGLILVLATRMKQRLGDMAAGTVVLNVEDVAPPARRKLKSMRITFIVLAAAGIISLIGGIATFSQWIQQIDRPQTFVTADGRYELSVPASFKESQEPHDGLFLSSTERASFFYVREASEEWREEYTLEEYADHMLAGLLEDYEAVRVGSGVEQLELNGNDAYRFMMHSEAEEPGYWDAYTVTVTGDEEQYYCIIALFVGRSEGMDGVTQFRERYASSIAKLEKWTGTFKKVIPTLSM